MRLKAIKDKRQIRGVQATIYNRGIKHRLDITQHRCGSRQLKFWHSLFANSGFAPPANTNTVGDEIISDRNGTGLIVLVIPKTLTTFSTGMQLYRILGVDKPMGQQNPFFGLI